MEEHEIEITTADGRCDAFICHPDEGGPFPAVIFLMDAMGFRDELRDMARRLATSGYCVLLPNLYYRQMHGDPQIDANKIDQKGPQRDLMWKLLYGIDIDKVTADCKYFLEYLAAYPAAGKGPVGTVGYCMSGRYAMGAAAAYPDRVAAMASYYGAGLFTDKPDSPHLRVGTIKAECYFAFAEHDPFVPQREVEGLRTVLAQAGVSARMETYPGSHHGFAFPQRAAYDRRSEDRHWERLIALFRRTLSN